MHWIECKVQYQQLFLLGNIAQPLYNILVFSVGGAHILNNSVVVTVLFQEIKNVGLKWCSAWEYSTYIFC